MKNKDKDFLSSFKHHSLHVNWASVCLSLAISSLICFGFCSWTQNIHIVSYSESVTVERIQTFDKKVLGYCEVYHD